MTKSWLTFLLPKDEFKRSKLTSFFAEAAVLLTAACALFILFQPTVKASPLSVLMIILGFISAYVLIRYVSSGIEYSDVFEKKSYRREQRKIVQNGGFFMLLFFILTFTLREFAGFTFSVSDLFGLSFLSGALMIGMNLVSLTLSYRKNQSLLDEN